MKKIKLFTHTDLDGVGCAIVASLGFPATVYCIDTTYVDYRDVNQEVSQYLDRDETDVFLLITDISVNPEVAKRIDQIKFDKKLLLDHHATAFDALSSYSWCEIVTTNIHTFEKESGTSLLFQYLVDENFLSGMMCSRLKTFSDIVTNWDTWTWKANNCRIAPKLNDLLQLWGIDKFRQWCKSWISCECYPELDYAGVINTNILSEVKQQYIKEKSDGIIIRTTKDGYDYGVVFADKYISELGNTLCEKYSELEFITIINMSNQSINFRSIHHQLDLGKDIASKIGGGGHPQAAGATVSSSYVKKVIDDLLKF